VSWLPPDNSKHGVTCDLLRTGLTTTLTAPAEMLHYSHLSALMHGGRCASEVSQLAGSGAQQFNTARDPEPVKCPPHTVCGRQTSCTAQIYYYYHYYYYYYYISTNALSCAAQRVGRDSSVGTATRYGLDDEGIEFRWGRDFFPTGPVAHPASSTTGTGSRSWG